MKKMILVSAAIAAFATGALAQQSTVNGAVGGAVTGAIVGGPVGAAVGASAGTVIDPPPERVVRYVETQPMPMQPVVIQEQVVVGRQIPQQVVLTSVPEDPSYAYAVVNQQRVIVDPQTHTVVRVLN